MTIHTQTLDSMPTHPCFRKLLPLAVALYGRKSKLACHHKTRPVAYVPFTTGVSQGDGSGSGFSSLPAHFAGVQTLAQYPDIPARILSIMDDFHLIAALKYLGPIFSTLRTILHECVGVEINLSKSSLNVLQASTIANPRNAMTLAYEQCPILAELPLVTEGFICVGTPLGPLPYIRNFMTKLHTELKAEFQNLLSYPYPHDFMLFVRYCCNLKIAHLLRHLGPQILDYAQHFDAIIDQLTDEYYDLRLQSQALISLHDIPANLSSLSLKCKWRN